jgi:uncharacterized protein YecT (DUF1311 family)
MAFVYSPLIFSASTQSSNICKEVEDNKKFVIKLSKSRQAIICTLDSFRIAGDLCEQADSNIDFSSYIVWKNIVDLNNDGNYDLILSKTPSGLWHGINIYFIFAGCGNGVYIKLSTLSYGFLRIKQNNNNKKNWLQLEAVKLTPINSDYVAFDSQSILLDFDRKNMEYTEKYVGNIDTGFTEEDTPQNIPKNFNIEWDKFPDIATIQQLYPTSHSFNCAKASTQIEKNICGDTELTKADNQLSEDFRKLNSTLKDSQKERLLTEQKAWLKQRNLCKNARCLLESYSWRIQELRRNYKEQLDATP